MSIHPLSLADFRRCRKFQTSHREVFFPKMGLLSSVLSKHLGEGQTFVDGLGCFFKEFRIRYNVFVPDLSVQSEDVNGRH